MNTFTGHRSFAAGAWHLLGRHFIFYFIAKVRREGRVHRELSASLRLFLSLSFSLSLSISNALFLKEMKNFMSYFLFNFFRFFLCTPLPTPHLRKWACAWPAAKLIMDERSASCRIVSRRLASRRNVAQLTLFLIPELPTFGRR